MDFNDQKARLEKKNESKKLSKEAALTAKKEYAEKMVALTESRKKQLAELNNAYQSNIQGKSKGEVKQLTKQFKREKKYLLKSEHSQKKRYHSTRGNEKTYRHYLDAADAFFARPPIWAYTLLCVAIFLGFFIYFGINRKRFTSWETSLEQLKGFFKGFFVPDYDLFFGTGIWKFTDSAFYLCIQTFAIAFVGTIFASLLAIPFGFLASHKLRGKKAIVSEIILILIRTLPEIVFCRIMVMVTGFGPFTGVIVLSIQSIGRVGKRYSDDLDSRDFKFLDALDACGGSRLSEIRVGIFPQVSSNFISTILYRFDLNLRNASILGLVGAGDLGRLILNYSTNQNWEQLGTLLWGLLVRVMLVDFVSTQIRKKLV